MFKHKDISEYTESSFYTQYYFTKFTILTGLTDALTPVIKVRPGPINIKEDEIAVWMVGHATVLINFLGTIILTDPVFVNWIPFPRRIVAPGWSIKDLPPINYIIISHAHYDHFNIKSLKKLVSKSETVVVPKNCLDLIKGINYKNKYEMGWDEEKNFDDLRIFAYKAVHEGRRYPWEKNIRGYNCYIFEKNGKAIFFSGDTGYGNLFNEIALRHKNIVTAFIGIAAYQPYAFMKSLHTSPNDALKGFKDLRAQTLVPIHWGNFRLTPEPLGEPLKLFKELVKSQGLTNNVHILNNGQSVRI